MRTAVAIFSLTAFGVFYVLALYPLGLALYSRWKRSPIRKANYTPTISVILPVRNGERWIQPKLESLFASTYPPELIRIIVISDGSTDATASLVASWNDARVELLELPPGGKAVAINRGIETATGEIVVFTDVRQRFEELAIAKLISCFNDPTVGVVTGELVITEGANREEVNTGLYWKYEKWIRRNLNAIGAMTGATGAIYAVRRELLRPLPPDTLLDDVHIPLAAIRNDRRIFFECDAKAYDLPTSLKSEFRRKIRTQAGVYQIMRRFPRLLWPNNRRSFNFLSHKVGRLLLPFFFLAVLLSTPFLPALLRYPAAATQFLFYGTALIDPLVPEASLLKRFTAVTRAFITLVAAALCAISIFISPPQTLWKDTRAAVAQANDESPNRS